MDNCKIINKCLLCDGSTREILHLSNTPLANEFVLDKNIIQQEFPLNLIQCNNCNHVQLDCIVDQDVLYKNYYYVSGTSTVNVEHFKKYAWDIMFNHLKVLPFNGGKYVSNNEDSDHHPLVIDIGSNDGTLLRNFQDNGCFVLGVDPAENIATEATKNGIKTIAKFFNKETAIELKKEIYNRKAKVITCNNMFAHNEKLDNVVNGVLELLSKDGIFIIENSYFIDMCDKTLVDLIYHEHMHHHHVTSLIKYFSKFELDVYDVKRLPNHGGSIRVYTCRKGGRQIKQSVIDIIDFEKDINEKIIYFEENIKKLGNELRSKLQDIKSQNKSIAIYGVPAKATTIMYVLNIDESLIDFAVDDAILKQNTFTPGKHIQVLHPDEIYKRNPDYILILGWNFAESIMKNHNNFKGKWIIPLPELKEY